MKYTFNFIYLLTLVLIGNSAVATISPDINQV